MPIEDQQFGAHPVMVLSLRAVATALRRQTAVIIGKSITLNGHDFTVIGVTAEGFRGTFPVGGPDLWVPFAMYRRCSPGSAPKATNRVAASCIRRLRG